MIYILKYKEDEQEYWNNCEIALKTLAENDEEQIGDLNWRINRLKMKEIKSKRGNEKIWKRRNHIERRRRKRYD